MKYLKLVLEKSLAGLFLFLIAGLVHAAPSVQEAAQRSHQLERLKRQNSFQRQSNSRVHRHLLNHKLFLIRSKITQLEVRRSALNAKKPHDQMELSGIELELIGLKQREASLRKERTRIRF